MSLIAALLETIILDGVAEAVRPRSGLGWVGRALAFGAAAILVNAWLLWFAASPPAWTSGAIVITYVGGSVGILASAIHFVREPYDRLLSLSAIISNVVAIALAFAGG